jgi:hypothetical protein
MFASVPITYRWDLAAAVKTFSCQGRFARVSADGSTLLCVRQNPERVGVWKDDALINEREDVVVVDRYIGMSMALSPQGNRVAWTLAIPDGDRTFYAIELVDIPSGSPRRAFTGARFPWQLGLFAAPRRIDLSPDGGAALVILPEGGTGFDYRGWDFELSHRIDLDLTFRDGME